eukprot:1193459-Prorocentrum_minimum.AAC.4
MAAQSPYRPESVHVDDVGGHLLEDPLEQNRQLVVEAIHLNAQAEPLVEHGRVQAGHVRQVARLVEGVLHQLQRQEETKVALSCKCVWEGGRVRSRWAREYLRTLRLYLDHGGGHRAEHVCARGGEAVVQLVPHLQTNSGNHTSGSKRLHTSGSKRLHSLSSKRLHTLGSKRLHASGSKRLHSLSSKRLHTSGYKRLHSLGSKRLHSLSSKRLHTLGSK